MSDTIGTFDPEERAREKQASRDRDDAEIAAGLATHAEINRRNGAFAFPRHRIRIRYGSAGRIK